MSYCPEHGTEMQNLYPDQSIPLATVYQCPEDDGGVWVYEGYDYPAKYVFWQELQQALDMYDVEG